MALNHSLTTQPLSARVEARYRAALASGSLVFSKSEKTVIRTNSGILFQLRFCPSLAKKPTPKSSEKSPPKKKFDPFENPTGDLFIEKFPNHASSHFLVLNKFPIIASHFILATTEFKEQTDELEVEDLKVTYELLRAWPEGSDGAKNDNRLFAFFNCGPESGASQPHRHLQFLPVKSILEGDGGGWRLLLDDLVGEKVQVPFSYFARRVPNDTSPEVIHGLYLDLLQEASVAWKAQRASKERLESTSVGFSYNLGMTSKAMVLCPRVSEGSTLNDENGAEVGRVALNGTLLAGTLMVKREEEWTFLRSSRNGLDKVLQEIGLFKRSEASEAAYM